MGDLLETEPFSCTKVFDINARLSFTVMMRTIIGVKDCIWWIKDFLKVNFSKKIKIKKIFIFLKILTKELFDNIYLY